MHNSHWAKSDVTLWEKEIKSFLRSDRNWHFLMMVRHKKKLFQHAPSAWDDESSQVASPSPHPLPLPAPDAMATTPALVSTGEWVVPGRVRVRVWGSVRIQLSRRAEVTRCWGRCDSFFFSLLFLFSFSSFIVFFFSIFFAVQHRFEYEQVSETSEHCPRHSKQNYRCFRVLPLCVLGYSGLCCCCCCCCFSESAAVT